MQKQIAKWLPASALALVLSSPLAFAGFGVQGGTLVEGNGTPFVMRGVNHAHVWYTHTSQQALSDIAATGSNTVRIVLADGNGGMGGRVSGAEVAQLIQWCKDNKLIAVLEVHDATGYGDVNYAPNAENPINTVNYWLSPDIRKAIDNQEDYVIINIANEPLGNEKASEWTSLQTQSIQRMRQAGIKHTIMVDAPNWGQDWSNTMRNNALTVFNADTARNTIFSVHMYESYGNDTAVQSYLQDFKSKNLPLVVGEFGADHKGAPVDEDAIMARAQQLAVGYLGWSWSGNNAETQSLDITNNFDVNSLTSWGNRLINGSNGIKQTSRLATIFGGNQSSSTASSSTNNNIATGKPVSASSFEGVGFEAEKAFDNSTATRWASALTASTASLTVDLGGYYTLTGVKLSWETAYAKSYNIEISSDNVNWSNLFTKTNGTGGTESISLTGQGRYLRINMTAKANANWGYSLWDVAVYDSHSSSLASSTNSSSSSSSIAPSSSSSASSLAPGQFNCNQAPANLQSSIQTKNLLCYLKNSSFISGQTDMPDSEKVQQWTGRYPAIVAFDFYRYTDGDTSETQKAIDFAKNRKGIVTFQWHWKCPRGGEYYTDCAFDQDMNNSGSKLYQDIDVIARELKKMSDAGVPVMFRPLHEANDNFMWWAKKGADNYKRLWKLIYDRVNAQGATNVIWVFNGMANTAGYRSNMRDWYPGDSMVDVVSSDYYQSWSDYNTLKAIGNNKIVGISETFNALNPANDPPFSFSVVWAFRDCYQVQGQPSSGDVKGCENSWRTAMSNSKTISIDQLPDFNSNDPGPTNLATNKAVVASSVEGPGYEAARGVDNSSSTRWASATNAATATYTIDLAGMHNLTSVRLNWEAAYATAYNLQTSIDGVTFSSPIYSKTAGTGGVENIVVNGQGRFLRINMTAKANVNWGYSLWEVGVFGTPATGSSSSSSVATSSVVAISSSKPSSASLSSVRSSAPQGSLTCSVSQKGTWSGGYQLEVKVTNPGPAVNNWTVYLNYAQPAQISSYWNANLTGSGTTRVTATNVGYNGSLGTGASTTFGLTGNSATALVLPGCSGQPVITPYSSSSTSSAVTTSASSLGNSSNSSAFSSAASSLSSSAATFRVNATGDITKNGDIFSAKCGNWFGLEGQFEPKDAAVNPGGAPMELLMGNQWWADTGRTLQQTMNEIKAKGINMIRLPISPQTLNANDPQGLGDVQSGGVLKAHPSVRQTNSRQALESFIKLAAANNIQVLVDIHSCSNYVGWRAGVLNAKPPYVDAHRPGYNYSREDYSCAATGNPSSVKVVHAYDKAKWLADLKEIAGLSEKLGVDNIIGIDIFNEPWGYSWLEWKELAEEAFVAVNSVNPNILLFVEGVSDKTIAGNAEPFGDPDFNPNWGENLYGMINNPLNIPKDRLVLSPHTYGPSVFVQKQFMDVTQPGCEGASGEEAAAKECRIVIDPVKLAKGWDEHFGNLRAQGYAIIVGEYGGNMDWPKKTSSAEQAMWGHITTNVDEQWQNAFTDYMISRDIQACYWAINPESGDTLGWYTSPFDPVSNAAAWGTWGPLDQRKTEMLNRLWAQ